MPDDLAEVAAASPENIEIASKGLASETLLHLQGQAAHAAPHVRVPRRDPYPNAGGDWDHGLTDRSTADTSPGETPAGISPLARARKRVVSGKRVSVRVEPGGRSISTKEQNETQA